MTEPADQPAPPLRTWRPMALWSAVILVALGLAWFIGAGVMPFLQARAALRESQGVFTSPMPAGPDTEKAFIDRLGGPERAVHRLRTYLRFPLWATPQRAEAVWLMGRCGDPAADALREVLRHADPAVRVMAVDALRRFCRTDDVPAFVAAVTDRDASVRRYAILALGGVGEPAAGAVPSLTAALADVDENVRAEAARALGKIGAAARAAAPALERAFADANDRVRDEAACAHCLITGEPGKGVPVLLRALADENEYVRTNAAWTLGELGPLAEPAVPALTRALQDEKHGVRESAARALGDVGPAASSAIPALEALEGRLTDEDWFIRKSVREALKNIRGEVGTK